MRDEIHFLREENQKIKNDYNSKINALEKEIKEIKEKLLPLKEEKDKEEKDNNFPDSKILKNIEEKKLVLNWIKPNSKIKLTLLYQASRDGDRISTFYTKVSNKSPTIFIIKANSGFKFGGYTTNIWTNPNGNYRKDELAFLFSIDKKKKYQINKDKVGNAICAGSNYIAFGGGYDFCINDQCKTNFQYSNFPITYSNEEKSELTGGQYNFLISDYEVYHVEFI